MKGEKKEEVDEMRTKQVPWRGERKHGSVGFKDDGLVLRLGAYNVHAA